MGGTKEAHVGLELAPGDEGTPEPPDRHVGEHEQPIEPDPVALAELVLVPRFEIVLGRRQDRPLGIEYEVQGETRIRIAVAASVETPQPVDAPFEYPLAALPVYVVLPVARERRDDLDPVGGEKLGEPCLDLRRLLEDREVAAVHDVHTEPAGALDQVAERRVELRRPPR